MSNGVTLEWKSRLAIRRLEHICQNFCHYFTECRLIDYLFPCLIRAQIDGHLSRKIIKI